MASATIAEYSSSEGAYVGSSSELFAATSFDGDLAMLTALPDDCALVDELFVVGSVLERARAQATALRTELASCALEVSALVERIRARVDVLTEGARPSCMLMGDLPSSDPSSPSGQQCFFCIGALAVLGPALDQLEHSVRQCRYAQVELEVTADELDNVVAISSFDASACDLFEAEQAEARVELEVARGAVRFAAVTDAEASCAEPELRDACTGCGSTVFAGPVLTDVGLTSP